MCLAACTVRNGFSARHTVLVKVTRNAVSVTCLRLQLVPPVVHKGLELSVNMSQHDADIAIMHDDHNFKIMTRHTMICTANSRPFSLCLLQVRSILRCHTSELAKTVAPAHQHPDQHMHGLRCHKHHTTEGAQITPLVTCSWHLKPTLIILAAAAV